jgi:hypothetical protein
VSRAGACRDLSEWLWGGDDGGTGEHGVDFEVGFGRLGKEPFFQAVLCPHKVAVFTLFGLAMYQSGMSSLPRDSFTLSTGASCPRLFSGTCIKMTVRLEGKIHSTHPRYV